MEQSLYSTRDCFFCNAISFKNFSLQNCQTAAAALACLANAHGLLKSF